MATRFYIALVIFILASFVLFGVALLFILMIPSLSAHALKILPVIALISVPVGAIAAWLIVPKIAGPTVREG
jgi:hypothetical protein